MRLCCLYPALGLQSDPASGWLFQESLVITTVTENALDLLRINQVIDDLDLFTSRRSLDDPYQAFSKRQDPFQSNSAVIMTQDWVNG